MPALYIPSLSYEPEDSDEHVIASLADRRRENIFLFFYITNERVQLTTNNLFFTQWTRFFAEGKCQDNESLSHIVYDELEK